MRYLYLCFFILFCCSSQGQSFLRILEGEASTGEDSTGFSIKKELKIDIGSVFSDSLKTDSFVTAFENKNFKKSLKTWRQTIEGSSFSKSSTGKALYAYLLFKNGLEYLSVYSLFTFSDPKSIDPIVRNLWKNEKFHPLWKTFYFSIPPEWQLLFEPELIIKVNSRQGFDLNKDHKFLKSLLSLPLPETFYNFDLEWSFLLSYLKKEDKQTVAKLLSWFLSQEKYKGKKDKIYLSIGRLLADIGEFPAALSYYKKAADLGQKGKLSYLTLLAHEEMSWIFLNQNKVDQARQKALFFKHTGLSLSPSMFFVLALSELRSCDTLGAFQTLKFFKNAFLNSNSLKYFFDKKDFDTLSKALLKYYQSGSDPFAVNVTLWPYRVRLDSRLKSQILFYNYLETNYKKHSASPFKDLYKKQEALIQKIKKERDQRFFTLLEREYRDRQTFLNYFKILELEILYQNHVEKTSSHKVLLSQKKLKPFSRSSNFIYFPFYREEVWLDELFDYKVSKNKSCLKQGFKR